MKLDSAIEKYKKLSTKELGKLGEMAFEKDCYLKGFKISKACVEAYPYDYILDIEGKLYRIQVKTTINYDGDKYRFSTNKTSLVHGKWKSSKYTPEDVDYFYLYCLLFPIQYLLFLNHLSCLYHLYFVLYNSILLFHNECRFYNKVFLFL